MMKIVLIALFALVAVASASLMVDVIPHYGKHGGHGISSRYFKKAPTDGYGLGYGMGLGYGGYGLGYGLGGGYGGYGMGGYGGYGGYGMGGYGGYGGYGMGYY